MSAADEIAANVAAVRDRIEAAARRASRDPSEVTLVAVTKTRPLEDLKAAHAAGIRHFGENRVQEAEAKFPTLPSDAVRHLIGPIQSNKAARAARIADVVESVDSLELARRLDRAAKESERTLRVFLEVNIGNEATKAGVAAEACAPLAAALRGLSALDLRGLMAIPPPGEGRKHFAALRALAERLGLPELSMGMSDDFEEAIEEGATTVRIGSALFGRRQP